MNFLIFFLIFAIKKNKENQIQNRKITYPEKNLVFLENCLKMITG